MWVDSCSIDVGSVRAGLRTNSAAASDALALAFAPLVVDDPDAPGNFSILFSQDPQHAHLLYWGGCVAARSFDPDRLLRALVDHVAAHLEPPSGLVWIQSLAFVRDGRAVLMPTPLDDDLRIVDRQARAEGLVRLDSPRVLVDLAAGELVVADLLDLDPDELARVADGVPRRRAEPTAPQGRYPIERWVFIDYTRRCGPVGRATATRAAILEVLAGVDAPDKDLLSTVAELFRSTKADSMFPDYPAAILDSLLDRPRRT